MRKYPLILILVFLISCGSSENTQLGFNTSDATQIDTIPGECAYLTKDNDGNAVLSWVRTIDDSTTAFCYAVHRDGKKFSSPIVIPNTAAVQPHGENLPKLVFKPSGEIIALWGQANPGPKNKYSGKVYYTQSFDKGKSWNTPKPLVTDTAGVDQRYYDVALLPNGEAGIIWLDNRKKTRKQGSAMYFATTNGKNGFENEKLINEPCCQCCRTDLFVDRKGGIHALFRGIVQDSIRDMVHMVSNDGGSSFSPAKRISEDNWVLNACPHTGPAMTENQDGIHFAWFTGGARPGCYYTKSTDNGSSFVQHSSISAKGSHPQLAALPKGELLIVWDESGTENNKVYRKIGVQKRSADGKALDKTYLTANDSNASYPVITALDEQSSLVAYSLKKGKKNYVTYQLLYIK